MAHGRGWRGSGSGVNYMAYDAEKCRANRDYYLKNGRCPRCGGKHPIEPGFKRCRECAIKASQDRQNQRMFRLENRLCTRCGKPLEDNSTFVQCEVCRAYIGTFRAFNKQRYEGLKEQGKCVKCGEWAEPGRTMCRKCLDDHKAYEQSYGDRLKVIKRARREGFKAVGLCIDCGQPTDGTHTRCKRCREMRMDSCRKYRITKRIEREAQEARANANHA